MVFEVSSCERFCQFCYQLNTLCFYDVQMMSLVDLGKQLLEAAKLGHTEQVRLLMSNGAPFTTDWVSLQGRA